MAVSANAPITPWPVPPEVRQVLLVGGSFDPPHAGHVALPAAARDALDAQAWLVYIPAGHSPMKAAPGAAGEHRLAMLRLALEGVSRAAVWTDELDRAAAGSPSYTIDTLRRAAVVAPAGTRLRLVIGADQAAQFHRWREFREVQRLAPPLVQLRSPLDTREALRVALLGAGVWRADEIGRWLDAVATTPVRAASATAVRGKVSEGRELGLDDVAVGVSEYIRDMRLYL